MKNKLRYSRLLILLLCMFLLTTCKAIIEQDLSNEKVNIEAPNASSLEGYTQTFWWDKVDGALSYEVTIVSPNFNTIQTLIVDSITTNNKFTYTFAPGNYEWRVKALNGSSQTGYSGSKFTILLSDISTQHVTLYTPHNTGYSNSPSTKGTSLSWSSLYGVDGYELQVDNNQGKFSGTFFLNTTSLSTTDTIYPATETVYYWRVRGYTVKDNVKDTSVWSSTFSFTYDVTPPDQVSLLSPANNLTSTNAAKGTLTWTAVSGAVSYNLLITYGTAAQTQVTDITSTSYSYSGTSGNTVFWQVQAVDAAGNVGALSDQWSFKIQ